MPLFKWHVESVCGGVCWLLIGVNDRLSYITAAMHDGANYPLRSGGVERLMMCTWGQHAQIV
jgi:hypothetical protein